MPRKVVWNLFFGDFSHSKKLTKIKPTLSNWPTKLLTLQSEGSIFKILPSGLVIMVSLFGDMKITLEPSDYFLPLIMTEIFDIRNFLSSDILFLWIEFIFGDLWIERFPKTDWGADLKFWKLSFEFKRGFKEEKKTKARAVQTSNACFAMRPTMSQTYNYYQKNTPGPHIMRIHLVRNSTSARFGKNPQIFT